MSPGSSSGRRAGGLCFRSITQANTTHTWDPGVHNQTLAFTLKGLIAKPKQSRRDQHTGEHIKRPKRADHGGKMSIKSGSERENTEGIMLMRKGTGSGKSIYGKRVSVVLCSCAGSSGRKTV